MQRFVRFLQTVPAHGGIANSLIVDPKVLTRIAYSYKVKADKEAKLQEIMPKSESFEGAFQELYANLRPKIGKGKVVSCDNLEKLFKLAESENELDFVLSLVKRNKFLCFNQMPKVSNSVAAILAPKNMKLLLQMFIDRKQYGLLINEPLLSFLLQSNLENAKANPESIKDCINHAFQIILLAEDHFIPLNEAVINLVKEVVKMDPEQEELLKQF